MASTPSTILRIQLIGTGDQAGTWGSTTNTNLGTLLEGAIAGLASVSVTAADQALVATDYVADQARMALITLTTTTSANFNVYAPPVSKQYTIYNNSSYTATIYNATAANGTTAAGTGIAIPAGKIMSVWSTGTNFYKNNTAQISLTTDVSGSLPLANGGTGGTDAATARTNLDVPTRTGGNASGTWAINISGNAATATSATSPASGGTFITSLNIGSQSVNYATNAGYPNSGGTFITSANIGSQSVASATTATSPAGGGTFITSLNIGSQSVNYATNAGYPNSGGTFITSANIGSQSVSYASSAQNAVYADLPTSGGTFITSSNIGSQSVSYATNAGFPNSGGTFITSANIGSQSVASATNATNATNASNLIANNWSVVQDASNYLVFRYNGVNKMRLDPSGNLITVGDITAYGSL